MQFKIKNTVYEISFSFLALILLIVTTRADLSFLIVLIFALLHELVHLFFIYLFSTAPKKVSFTLFGADILREITSINNYNAEIVINSSAPIFNLIISGITFIILNHFTVYKGILTDVAQVNLVLGIFNLIPFYNFDGGNVLNNVLLKYLNEKNTQMILSVISVLVTVIFSFISIYIFFNFQHNFSLIIMSIYMILTTIFKK